MFSIKMKKGKFFGNEKRFSSNYLNYVHFEEVEWDLGYKKSSLKLPIVSDFWGVKMFDLLSKWTWLRWISCWDLFLWLRVNNVC